ncbi:hypothetical protein DERP_001116 [Dermatophagoides pteronyssinus]|uniref:Uncharacterized protein n=1 Tax=Dermatophagoides pteronyssinus TaxID=6956 RepID=A0ABQ8JEA3_DERPT|nr:hypothetical protein DERP_001116 [Dermatophagoides pteronyssinus]
MKLRKVYEISTLLFTCKTGFLFRYAPVETKPDEKRNSSGEGVGRDKDNICLLIENDEIVLPTFLALSLLADDCNVDFDVSGFSNEFSSFFATTLPVDDLIDISSCDCLADFESNNSDIVLEHTNNLNIFLLTRSAISFICDRDNLTSILSNFDLDLDFDLEDDRDCSRLLGRIAADNVIDFLGPDLNLPMSEFNLSLTDFDFDQAEKIDYYNDKEKNIEQ